MTMHGEERMGMDKMQKEGTGEFDESVKNRLLLVVPDVAEDCEAGQE